MSFVAELPSYRVKHSVSLSNRIVALALLLFAASLAGAAGFERSAASGLLGDSPRFLPVDEAFEFAASVEEGDAGAVIVARFRIAEGYYLYRHPFAAVTRPARADALGALEIPPGTPKTDDYFGDVEIYRDALEVRLPILEPGRFDVGITWQGCADAGLCYPPETRWVAVDLGASDPAGSGERAAVDSGPGATAGSARSGAGGEGVTEDRRLAAVLADGSLLTAIALFFIGGIGLAFTPCVLPMVPILSSIIVGSGETITRGRAVALSISYVLGMALTYATVGTLIGLFGAGLNLQAALQTPLVLGTFALLFVALALSMFGYWELRLPQALQDRLDAAGARVGGGRHASVVVMGALSALVVSPCVSAPLAGALLYLSTTGDAVLGGVALLALGLGMGVPLVIVGASGGHLLPRSGPWMDAVKAVFGVGLLAVAIWLLERVVPSAVALVLWAALAIGAGVALGALDRSERRGFGHLWKALGVMGVVWGVLLLVGAARGAEDPLRPLAVFGATPAATEPAAGWEVVADLATLRARVAAAGGADRPVVLDVYADWCISCKVMERTVYPVPEVGSRLSRFVQLKVDVTANSAADRALLESLGLFGPPSLVFFGPNGTELPGTRVQGEIDAAALAQHLDRVLALAAAAPAVAAVTRSATDLPREIGDDY
ncbi:MAG TPA: thiol:disulfide interchange protein [Gammaproteobacteria bacterium]|jgi:thiol:disulfide interchange protein DsbD|nr:thiol:disulfide interchange protein [Gammaproteobacteria bacterium]